MACAVSFAAFGRLHFEEAAVGFVGIGIAVVFVGILNQVMG